MPILFIPSAATAAVKGIIDYSEAKKITKEAEKLCQEKMVELDENYERLIKTLMNLGKLKKEIYEEFELFFNVMGKIHNRPQIYNSAMHQKLPKLDIENIRDTMEKVQRIPKNDFAAFAASGVKRALLIPIPGVNLLVGGMFILRKGKQSKKEAESQMDRAREMEETVVKTNKNMMEIRKAVNSFYMAMYDIKRFYDRYLHRFREDIERGEKEDWEELSKGEKLKVENLDMLTRILHKMCQIEIIKDKEEEIGSLNSESVAEAIESMEEAIDKVNESERIA